MMDARRLLGAVGGGLVAGLGITALLMAGERRSGEPSELTVLERATAHQLGIETAGPHVLPGAREQAIVQGGHLALSALAGVAYAATVDEEADGVVSGVAFGLAFYAAMHWITGPLLAVKKPEWTSGAGGIAMHTLNHVLFGLATAGGARLAKGRPPAAY